MIGVYSAKFTAEREGEYTTDTNNHIIQSIHIATRRTGIVALS